LGLQLPPSYRAFLELHNGYDGLAAPGHMISTHEAMPKGAWYDRIQHWKKTSTRYGMGEVLDVVAIANLDSAVNWAYLDPNRPKKGELTVCIWLNGDRSDYGDMVAFFESLIDYCRVDLEARRARKKKQ
jgi:hypothetical protein